MPGSLCQKIRKDAKSVEATGMFCMEDILTFEFQE